MAGCAGRGGEHEGRPSSALDTMRRPTCPVLPVVGERRQTGRKTRPRVLRRTASPRSGQTTAQWKCSGLNEGWRTVMSTSAMWSRRWMASSRRKTAAWACSCGWPHEDLGVAWSAQGKWQPQEVAARSSRPQSRRGLIPTVWYHRYACVPHPAAPAPRADRTRAL